MLHETELVMEKLIYTWRPKMPENAGIDCHQEYSLEQSGASHTIDRKAIATVMAAQTGERASGSSHFQPAKPRASGERTTGERASG